MSFALQLLAFPFKEGLGWFGFDLDCHRKIKPIPIPAFPLKGKAKIKGSGACSAAFASEVVIPAKAGMTAEKLLRLGECILMLRIAQH